jgi:pyruvate-ferredoxin/flavodoxin oxidoreductase
MTGVVQNQDSYMKGRIGQRAYYDRLRPALDEAFALWASLTGRAYLPVRQHRCSDADEILVSMGTIDDTTEAVVDVLRRDGRPVGPPPSRPSDPSPPTIFAASSGRLGRWSWSSGPTSQPRPTTRSPARTKAALYAAAAEGAMVPRVLSVSAGLGSRDVGAGDLAAIFDWAASTASGTATTRRRDPSSARARARPIDVRPRGAYSLRGHSIGGSGPSRPTS